MSDQTQQPQQDETPQTEATDEIQQQDDQQLDEHDQDLVKKAGAEAKKYRQRMRDAETERDDLRQQLDDLRQQVEDSEHQQEHQAMLERIAETTGVPGDLLGLLRGDSEEELTAAAQRFAQGMRQPQVIPGQEKQPERPVGNSFVDAFRPKP